MRKVFALVTFSALALGVWSVTSAKIAASVNAKPTHNNSYSAPTVAYPSLHSGIFGGLKGGYAWAKGNFRQDAQATAQNPVTSGQRFDLGMDGGEVGLFLGYDHYFQNNWVLGIEGSGQWTSLSGEFKQFSFAPNVISASNMRIQLKSDCSFDVALRLGRKVYEHSLWYIKAGAQFARFKMNMLNIQVNTLLNTSNVGAPLAAKRKYNAGFLTGLGVEIPLSCHCSVGAEYNFTMYQRLNVSRGSSIPNGDFLKASIRPIENQIVARIIWKI